MSAPAIPTFDPDRFMGSRVQAPTKVSGDAAAQFDPDAFMAKQGDGAPTTRQQLLNSGFWDSAWDALKSFPSLLYSMASGEAGKQAEAEHQRFLQLQQNGT